MTQFNGELLLLEFTVNLATTPSLYDNTKHTGCNGSDSCGLCAWAAFTEKRLGLSSSEY